MLKLGGGHDIKELGKKLINNNVNSKPSNREDLYNYVEGFYDLVNRAKEDFPVHERDTHGNIIDLTKMSKTPSLEQLIGS